MDRAAVGGLAEMRARFRMEAQVDRPSVFIEGGQP
jgi:hypothetical protein